MSRIKWRSVLPVVQLALYLMLVWYGCWYRPTWQQWFWNWISPHPESTAWAWIDGIESFPEQLAAGLNFPAAFLATLVLIPFEGKLNTGASIELTLHIVTVIFIPPLWYLVGKDLDARKKVKAVRGLEARKIIALTRLVSVALIGIFILAVYLIRGRSTVNGLALAWIVYGVMAALSFFRNQPARD